MSSSKTTSPTSAEPKRGRPPKITTQSGNTQNSLSAEDIVTIIKACHSAQVSYFKHENLEISFKAQEPEVQVPELNRTVVRNGQEKGGDGPPPLYSEHLEDLMISDPVAYEEEISKQLEEA